MNLEETSEIFLGLISIAGSLSHLRRYRLVLLRLNNVHYLEMNSIYWGHLVIQNYTDDRLSRCPVCVGPVQV
jgi:hypothetical protein